MDKQDTSHCARSGDKKIDFLARDMFHLLWPESYPRVTENERPNLFESTRLT